MSDSRSRNAPPSALSEPLALSPQPLYACLYNPPAPDRPASSARTLAELAQDFSPRFECHRDDVISIDISGLRRLFGDPHAIGEELRRSATSRELRVQVAVAATRTAAMVLAVARPGLTVVDLGGEAAALAPLPIGTLEKIGDDLTQRPRSSLRTLDQKGSAVSVLNRWGIRTLGALAALPSTDLAARLGQQGLVWQVLARGQDARPLVPTLPDERFESSVELEWPIEGLEPLSFVLTRLLEPLSTRLERRDRGAAALHVTFGLVSCHDHQRDDDQRRDRGERGEEFVQNSVSSADSALNDVIGDTYSRSLQLPSPMRDVRTLRTLILLDLESHPPPAAVECVSLLIHPTPARVLQHTLFTRAHPTPEQVSTLVARLIALLGQDRLGRPVLVDSYCPGAFEMAPFAPEHNQPLASSLQPQLVSALRRCRHPVPARVAVADGRPVYVTTDRCGFAGGRVLTCAGPWRTSGNWWVDGERLRPCRAEDMRIRPFDKLRVVPSEVEGRGEASASVRAGGGVPAPVKERWQAWDRDEWDVALGDGAVYRVFRDCETEAWFIDAIVD